MKDFITPATSQQQIDQTFAKWKKLSARPIAFDIETAASPTVVNGSGLHPHLGTLRLVQFALQTDEGYECIVIDCYKYNWSDGLEFLYDSNWPVLIQHAAMETRWIGWMFGFAITKVIDLEVVAKEIYSAKSMNLAKISETVLGRELDKTEQNGFWDAPNLTAEQLVYAGLDVLILLEIWQKLEPLMNEDLWKTVENARGRLKISAAKSIEADKGSEHPRIINMIENAADAREVEEIKANLCYARIHHSHVNAVNQASPKPIKQTTTKQWSKPF